MKLLRIIFGFLVAYAAGTAAYAVAFDPSQPYGTVQNACGQTFYLQGGVFYFPDGTSQGATLPACAQPATNFPNGITTNKLAVGGTISNSQNLRLAADITGGTPAIALQSIGVVKSDVATARYYQATMSTDAASFTLTTLTGFDATQATIGAGSTVTNQYGFLAHSTLTGATNNYGFRSDLAAATGVWNFFASATANNAFAGNTKIGAITIPAAALDVAGSGLVSGSFSIGAQANGLTLTSGAFGLTKITPSASAPGAAGAKLEVVCGTNTGTAKLIMYAGTSATAITIVDNVGTGVTGC